MADTGEWIFVFGCSRSGTTLLLNLFRAFRATKVVDREHRIEEFCRYRAGPLNVVMKRTPVCALDLGRELRRHPRVWLLDIIRDPRDVICSKYGGVGGFHTDFRRWARDVAAADEAELGHEHTLRIRFEELVLEPGKVQRRIEDRIGLSATTSFEDVHGLLQAAGLNPKERQALNSVRPLDAAVIGRWRRSAESRDRVRHQLISHPFLAQCLIDYGYEPDEQWISSLSAT